MAALGQLVVSLAANTASFTGAMDKAAYQAENRMKSMEQTVKKVSTAIGVALAASAAAVAVGIVATVNKQRQLIDEQAKLAQRLNTTYESLANLGRAGELAGVGMGQVEAASRALDLNLGKAIQGSKAQTLAFDRLGLKAEELAKIPLDERIAKINQALVTNVQAAERSAVAAEIFGAKNAAAMMALNPETIAEAARQVEIFGLNLSDVDAAKVEMANDAMSTFGMLTEGIGKQLTVELAPILKAIGDEFLRSAEEAGGLGTVVQDTTRRVVSALAFVIDAGDGVVRVFQLSLATGRMMAYGLSGLMIDLAGTIVNGPVVAVNNLIQALNRIPGIDIQPVFISRLGSAINAEMRRATAGFEEAKADIEAALTTPLAGDRLRTAYAAAQAAGEASAQAAVAGRIAARETGSAFVDTEKSAKRAKKAADEAAAAMKRLMQEGAQVAASMRTPIEILYDEYDKLNRLIDAGAISQETYNRAVIKAQDAFDQTRESVKKAKEEKERFDAMMEATPTAQIEKAREDMLLLEKAFLASRISAEQFVEAAQTRLGTLPDKIKETKDAMTVFAEQAGRNIQNAFADFLFNPFENGLEGMLKSFGVTLQRMIAEAAAAELAKKIGVWGASNSGGGFLGTIAGFAGKLFGGGRADGGPVSAGRTYLVGERGPEMITMGRDGMVTPNQKIAGDTHISVTVTGVSQPAEVRRAAGQGAREALAAMSGAQRYG